MAELKMAVQEPRKRPYTSLNRTIPERFTPGEKYSPIVHRTLASILADADQLENIPL